MAPDPSKFNPIEASWASYLKNVIPPDAPDVQVAETRMAFIAGSCACFWLITNASSQGSDETLKIISAIHKEVDTIANAAINEVLKRMPVGGHA